VTGRLLSSVAHFYLWFFGLTLLGIVLMVVAHVVADAVGVWWRERNAGGADASRVRSRRPPHGR
jgi:hypothetical protein